MKIKVIRENTDGLKQAPPIIDALCTIDAVGIERGRNFLNEYGYNKNIFEISLPYRDIPLPGKLVEVNDAQLGKKIKAQLLSCSISVIGMTRTSPVLVETEITIEESVIE